MPISNDPALLRQMISDAESQRDIYKPGPYWKRKSLNAATQIERYGLEDFRGDSSTIGLSFTDAVFVDVRHSLTGGLRGLVGYVLRAVFPFKDIFNSQVSLTRSHERETRRLKNLLLEGNPRVHELMHKYRMPPSLDCGCIDFIGPVGKGVSTLYLNLLHQHDLLTGSVEFSTVRSMFEIGGGFGANVHLMLENYSRLRKIVYLDIPPNLYVGTQYLKSIYGDAVRDYRQTRGEEAIRFSDDDKIEILAIAPWQIEKLDLSVDLIYNAHSFVEMPPFVVSNYAAWLERLPDAQSASIVMLTYDCFDLGTTFHPDTLPGFFPQRSFHRTTFQILDNSYGVISFIGRKSTTDPVSPD
ncbi:MAG: putative sugar O-methyltransferase [Pseudomonadota bacterium]